MSKKVKDRYKNCTSYFFNDVINIKAFDPNNAKTDKKYSYIPHSDDIWV